MGILNNKVLLNSFWMISEKIVSIFGLIFVTAFVAKYLGPENFGKLTFASSLFAIVQTVAMFGLENVIFQRTSKNRKLGEKIIFSTRVIRNTLYFIISPIVLIWVYLSNDYITFMFSLASCIGVFFATHDVYSIYFNAILQSKINAICNTIGLIIAFLIRYIIPIFHLDILWLSIPIICVTLIPFLLRVYYFNKVKQTYVIHYKHKVKVIKNSMLNTGKKLILYSLSVAIFIKTSQIFLGLQSKYELGIYSTAMSIGFGFSFVVSAFISSLMTQIYAENDFETSQNQVAQLYAITIVVSLAFLIFILVFGKFLIKELYGEKFLEVDNILWIMVIVCMFSILSTVSEKYMFKFRTSYSYLQKKINLLLLFNLIITYLLVKFLGIKGAVYSILITEFSTATIFNYFFQHGLIWDTHKRIFKLSTYKNLLKK